MKAFFLTLPQNIIEAFRGRNILYHLAAIAITAVLVLSGLDWWYFVATYHAWLDTILFPAIVLGALLPAIVPLLIITFGWIFRNTRAVMSGWAIGQAGVIGGLISATYKLLTNRVPPPFGELVDVSQGFQFGFMKNDVFWGWPSSHTTIAFAMSVALVMLYPKNKALRYTALLYAFYIGLGVSTSIHWLSEFVAGAIIGTVIGVVVGKSFRSQIANK
ncbi:MAG: phosphatase PAP2 family protein [Candidatus Paceibacterota bacterium]